MQAEAGKGSAPRKNQDQDAYRQNWDMIFGKKKRNEALEELVRLSEEAGLYDEKPNQTRSDRS